MTFECNNISIPKFENLSIRHNQIVLTSFALIKVKYLNIRVRN